MTTATDLKIFRWPSNLLTAILTQHGVNIRVIGSIHWNDDKPSTRQIIFWPQDCFTGEKMVSAFSESIKSVRRPL